MKGPAALLVIIFFSLPAQAELLLRAERLRRDDLTTLRHAGLPVTHETSHSLFLEGMHADVEALRARGFAVEILDRDAGRSDYLQVGLIPGADEAALFAIGAALYAEENWRLIRVPRGAPLEALRRAGFLVTRLGHEPVRATAVETRVGGGTEGVADPLIQRMVGAVDPLQIDRFWTDLADTGTRFTSSQGCLDAASYGHDEIELHGIPVELQEHSPWGMDHAPNVVGTHLGAVTPDRVYIVIGHLDDVPVSGPAPGADDNASGSVNVLESARVMSCYAFKSTIKFILPTGEEVGQLGSYAYAADAVARGEDIRGVLNFDMIGWEGDGTPGPENLDLSYNDPSEDLALLFAQSAATYNTGLSVDAFLCPSLAVSDHYSFWTHGFKAICGVTDNHGYCGHDGHNPYYHSANDTIANCGNPAFFHSVIRTSVATLATLAEPFKVTFEKDTVAPGAAARLILGDRDLNASAGSVETVVVEVSSSTEPTPEIFVLSEDGADSMIFAGDVPTTTRLPVAGDGAVSVSDGDLLSVRYVDAVDCDGSVNVTHTAGLGVDGTGLAPIEVDGLTVSPGSPAHLAWNGLTDAATYDVAGGTLGELRQDGDFARVACLASVAASSWHDPRPDPPPGDGYYYLPRARNPNGPGPFGNGRSLDACP